MAETLREIALPANFGVLGLRLKQQVISSIKPEQKKFWIEKGVRAGDLILAVDGHDTVGLPAAELVALLRKRPLTLKLRVHPEGGPVPAAADASGGAAEPADSQVTEEGGDENQQVTKASEEELLTAILEPTAMEGIFARSSPAPGAETCALLTDLRRLLAEAKLSRVSTEYLSFSRHLHRAKYARYARARLRDVVASDIPSAILKVPGCAGVDSIPRVASAPSRPAKPVVLKQGSFPAVSSWSLDWWQQNHGDWLWSARARTPAYSEDEGPDAVALEARIGDYIDYARLLMMVDPSCAEEDALANPRVHMQGWPCFRSEHLWEFFRAKWKDLSPPGVENLTAEWVQRLCLRFDMDWQEWLSRYFKVSFAAPGCISRLHKENGGAHLWLSQTEGQQLFILFAPQEAENLYETSGVRVEGVEGFAAAISPVDILFPSTRRHSHFSDARALATILKAGETLIVPSGWWWYSAALEPSATVQQWFFNWSNVQCLVAHFADLLEVDRMPPDMASHFTQLLEEGVALLVEDAEE